MNTPNNKPLRMTFGQRSLTILVLFFLLLTSCRKEAGFGGTSSIEGKIYVKDYDSNGFLIAEYYAREERVYIIYGDDNYYGDDLRTSYDGTYRFENLFPGDYTIYAYSDCEPAVCGARQIPVFANVTITRNKEKVMADTITVNR